MLIRIRSLSSFSHCVLHPEPFLLCRVNYIIENWKPIKSMLNTQAIYLYVAPENLRCMRLFPWLYIIPLNGAPKEYWSQEVFFTPMFSTKRLVHLISFLLKAFSSSYSRVMMSTTALFTQRNDGVTFKKGNWWRWRQNSIGNTLFQDRHWSSGIIPP